MRSRFDAHAKACAGRICTGRIPPRILSHAINEYCHLLKEDSKYMVVPKAYILANISVKNKHRNTYSAISKKNNITVQLQGRVKYVQSYLYLIVYPFLRM